MELFYIVVKIIVLIAKLILLAWSGYSFLSGDKEKMSTLWYGVLVIALLI